MLGFVTSWHYIILGMGWLKYTALAQAEHPLKSHLSVVSGSFAKKITMDLTPKLLLPNFLYKSFIIVFFKNGVLDWILEFIITFSFTRVSALKSTFPLEKIYVFFVIAQKEVVSILCGLGRQLPEVPKRGAWASNLPMWIEERIISRRVFT